jgi:hypothetical protein
MGRRVTPRERTSCYEHEVCLRPLWVHSGHVRMGKVRQPCPMDKVRQPDRPGGGEIRRRLHGRPELAYKAREMVTKGRLPRCRRPAPDRADDASD